MKLTINFTRGNLRKFFSIKGLRKSKRSLDYRPSNLLSLALTTYTLFYKDNLKGSKSLDFDKKIKNKLRTKPGLLSYRT